MRRRSPPSDDSSSLSDREAEIARRVRQSLHLSASMSENEVAQQFRGSVAWRRARLGLMGEELREGLAEAIRPAMSRMRSLFRPLARRVERLWEHFWR